MDAREFSFAEYGCGHKMDQAGVAMICGDDFLCLDCQKTMAQEEIEDFKNQVVNLVP